MNPIKQFFIIIIFSTAIISFPAMAEEDTTPPSNTDTYIKAGGLCVGGAILGSVVPILGNILGCAIGATAGYFWGTSDAPAEPAVAALDD